MENNQIVKLSARGAGVPLWRVAQELGISEATMTRKLRVPLSEEEKDEYLKIIEQLRREA